MLFGLVIALSTVGQCSAVAGGSCQGSFSYANPGYVFAVPAAVSYRIEAPEAVYRQTAVTYSGPSFQAGTVYVAKAKPFARLRANRAARRLARMNSCL